MREGEKWGPVKYGRSVIHRSSVDQPQPAFGDAVDHPEPSSNQDRPADQNEEQDQPDAGVEQGKPECPDLPAEVAFQIGSRHIFPFDVS